MKIKRILALKFSILFTFLMIGFCGSIPIFAQPNLEQIKDIREKINLNGEWEFKTKDGKNWKRIGVPSIVREKGTIFFRRSFQLSNETKNFQYILLFEGINFSSRVKLNGQYLATQTHGHTPLKIPVPAELLRFHRKNKLQVEVDTKLSNTSIPLSQSLFAPEPLRGIFRDVYLKKLPPVAISTVKYNASMEDDLSSVLLEYTIQINSNPNHLRQLSQSDLQETAYVLKFGFRKPKPSSQLVYSKTVSLNEATLKGEPIRISFEINDPILWSIQSPSRYDADFVIEQNNRVVDFFTEEIGLRDFHFQNNMLVLNGAKTTIRGITFVEDVHHWLTPDKKIKYLKTIKSLGFNTVTWFVPPPKRLLALSDSLGLLTILRVPVWNIPAPILNDASLQEDASHILIKLLDMAENHPSVLAISLGNGYDADEEASFNFIKSLHERVAASGKFLTTAGFRNDQKIGNRLPLDFLTSNVTQKHLPNISLWIDKWIMQYSEIPVLFSDISVPFVLTSHDSESVSVYESEQAYFFKKCVTSILEKPTLGYVLGSLYDWQGVYPTILSPSSPESRIFPFGLASRNKEPRMAWNMIQNINSDQPNQFSFQKREANRNKKNLFLFIGLGLAAFFLYYFRQDHRLRGNFIRILSRPFGFHIELKEGRKIPWALTLMVYFVVVLIGALILESLFYFLRLNPLFDFFLAQLAPSYPIHLLLIRMVWNPVLGFLGFAVIMAILLLLIGMYVRLLSIASRNTLPLRNAMTFITWESVIFIFLLPLAIVFYRLLSFPAIHLPLLILLLVFLFWYVYRLLKGSQTIYEFSGWLSVSFMIILPVLVVFFIIIFYDKSRSLIDHSEYLYHIWRTGL